MFLNLSCLSRKEDKRDKEGRQKDNKKNSLSATHKNA